MAFSGFKKIGEYDAGELGEGEVTVSFYDTDFAYDGKYDEKDWRYDGYYDDDDYDDDDSYYSDKYSRTAITKARTTAIKYKKNPKPVTTTAEAKIPYRVNLNTATYDDLIQLPEIDETLAKSILKLRTEIERFRDPYELLYADGMTDKLFSGVLNYVYV
jgi:hypothetical protein